MPVVVNPVFEHRGRLVELLESCIALIIKLFKGDWLTSDQNRCLVEEECAYRVLNDIIELSWPQEHRQHKRRRILVVRHLHLAEVVAVYEMSISEV